MLKLHTLLFCVQRDQHGRCTHLVYFLSRTFASPSTVLGPCLHLLSSSAERNFKVALGSLVRSPLLAVGDCPFKNFWSFGKTQCHTAHSCSCAVANSESRFRVLQHSANQVSMAVLTASRRPGTCLRLFVLALSTGHILAQVAGESEHLFLFYAPVFLR